MNDKRAFPVPKQATLLRQGAFWGAALTFAYALVFCLYAIVRISWTILAAGPLDAGVPGTLAANAACILIAALVMTALLSLSTAALGMVSAILIGRLFLIFKPKEASLQAAWLGVAGPLLISLLLLPALKLGVGFSPIKLPAETGLFWLGLPLIIYMGAGALAGWKMSRYTP
jgi:hypothetical protein